MAANCFQWNKLKWREHKLSTSYRLTKNMTIFLRDVIAHPNIINPHKSINPAIYYIHDRAPYACYSKDVAETFKIIQIITKLIDSNRYEYDDIFILSPSTKSRNSLQQIANCLSAAYKYPIFVALNENVRIDEELIKGKICFATFHQSKGLERSVVIVHGFSEAYFTYFAQNEPKERCTNALYVALSRSKELLILYHELAIKKPNNIMPFIRRDQLVKYIKEGVVRWVGPTDIIKKKESTSNKNKYKTVSQFISHLPYQAFEYMFKHMKVERINNPEHVIPFPEKVNQGSHMCEYVADIIGVMIPSYYAFKIHSQKIFSIKEETELIDLERKIEISNTKEEQTYAHDITQMSYIDYILRYSEEIFIKEQSVKDELRYSLIAKIAYSTLKRLRDNGYIFRRNQIKNYKWFDYDMLQIAIERLKKFIGEPKNPRFEVGVNENVKEEDIEKGAIVDGEILKLPMIYGRVDYIDEKRLIEFKCKNSLENADLMQLLAYIYLLGPDSEVREYYLFNIKTNELLMVHTTYEEVKQILIFAHSSRNHYIRESDEEFLKKVNSIICDIDNTN
jgi:hypothetical protein